MSYRATLSGEKVMLRFFITDPYRGKSVEIDFEDFITLARGTTIISAAHSDDFVELGLSENLLLHIESESHAPINVSTLSTLNVDDIPPTRIQLIGEKEEPSAMLVERRLHDLRQVYAILYMLNDGRGMH
jgi:hypothetical protein